MRPTRSRSTDFELSGRLEGEGAAAIEAAALAELRGAHADAGAVAQFVDLVEDVHQIQAGDELPPAGECKSVLHAEIDRMVLGQVVGVGKAAAQPASVEKVSGGGGASGPVRGAGGNGEQLVVVEVNVMRPDVVEFLLAELELAGDDLPAGGAAEGEVGVGGETVLGIVRGQLDALDFPVLVVKGRENQRLPELAFIEQVGDALVVAIEGGGERGRELV